MSQGPFLNFFVCLLGSPRGVFKETFPTIVDTLIRPNTYQSQSQTSSQTSNRLDVAILFPLSVETNARVLTQSTNTDSQQSNKEPDQYSNSNLNFTTFKSSSSSRFFDGVLESIAIVGRTIEQYPDEVAEEVFDHIIEPNHPHRGRYENQKQVREALEEIQKIQEQTINNTSNLNQQQNLNQFQIQLNLDTQHVPIKELQEKYSVIINSGIDQDMRSTEIFYVNGRVADAQGMKGVMSVSNDPRYPFYHWEKTLSTMKMERIYWRELYGYYDQSASDSESLKSHDGSNDDEQVQSEPQSDSDIDPDLKDKLSKNKNMKRVIQFPYFLTEKFLKRHMLGQGSSDNTFAAREDGLKILEEDVAWIVGLICTSNRNPILTASCQSKRSEFRRETWAKKRRLLEQELEKLSGKSNSQYRNNLNLNNNSESRSQQQISNILIEQGIKNHPWKHHLLDNFAIPILENAGVNQIYTELFLDPDPDFETPKSISQLGATASWSLRQYYASKGLERCFYAAHKLSITGKNRYGTNTGKYTYDWTVTIRPDIVFPQPFIYNASLHSSIKMPIEDPISYLSLYSSKYMMNSRDVNSMVMKENSSGSLSGYSTVYTGGGYTVNIAKKNDNDNSYTLSSVPDSDQKDNILSLRAAAESNENLNSNSDSSDSDSDNINHDYPETKPFQVKRAIIENGGKALRVKLHMVEGRGKTLGDVYGEDSESQSDSDPIIIHPHLNLTKVHETYLSTKQEVYLPFTNHFPSRLYGCVDDKFFILSWNVAQFFWRTAAQYYAKQWSEHAVSDFLKHDPNYFPHSNTINLNMKKYEIGKKILQSRFPDLFQRGEKEKWITVERKFQKGNTNSYSNDSSDSDSDWSWKILPSPYRYNDTLLGELINTPSQHVVFPYTTLAQRLWQSEKTVEKMGRIQNYCSGLGEHVVRYGRNYSSEIPGRDGAVSEYGNVWRRDERESVGYESEQLQENNLNQCHNAKSQSESLSNSNNSVNGQQLYFNSTLLFYRKLAHHEEQTTLKPANGLNFRAITNNRQGEKIPIFHFKKSTYLFRDENQIPEMDWIPQIIQKNKELNRNIELMAENDMQDYGIEDKQLKRTLSKTVNAIQDKVNDIQKDKTQSQSNDKTQSQQQSQSMTMQLLQTQSQLHQSALLSAPHPRKNWRPTDNRMSFPFEYKNFYLRNPHLRRRIDYNNNLTMTEQYTFFKRFKGISYNGPQGHIQTRVTDGTMVSYPFDPFDNQQDHPWISSFVKKEFTKKLNDENYDTPNSTYFGRTLKKDIVDQLVLYGSLMSGFRVTGVEKNLMLDTKSTKSKMGEKMKKIFDTIFDTSVKDQDQGHTGSEELKTYIIRKQMTGMREGRIFEEREIPYRWQKEVEEKQKAQQEGAKVSEPDSESKTENH